MATVPDVTLAGWFKDQPRSITAGPAAPLVAQPIAMAGGFTPFATSPPGSSLIPAQIRHAYGIDQVFFGSIQGDGTGQTIAIIDAYHYPSAFSDLNLFSQQFGLPTLAAYPSSSPYFRQVSQTGSSTSYPANAPSGTWAIESALDIEWAHAMAPGANILLVEANDASSTNLISNAANWARNQPGVVAVSMSFGIGEYSGEKSLDSVFTTPTGHAGVTFLAATGDTGQPSTYPAYSPNVLAVGGTTLSLSGTNYLGESGWSGSGGGISVYESQPSWQNSVVTQSTTKRTNPDIALDADPGTGVPIYDSYDFAGSPWQQYGGTSLATPMWAGLIAIAAQGRAVASLAPLDGATQTLPALYQLPASDFHDITSGSNGFAAGSGYDLVTGRGTPIGSVLINDLTGVGSIAGTVYEDRNSNGVNDAGDVPLGGSTVFVDSNNNGVLDAGTTISVPATGPSVSIPDKQTAGATWSLPVSGVSDPITGINITLNISDNRVSDLTGYLIGPDNTTVELFTGLSGINLTNTSFDDGGAALITSGTAPYTGTFRPGPGVLAAFNGKSGTAVNGTWKLKVVDSVTGISGSIISWSLNITAGAEESTLTGLDGKYSLNGVTYGSRVVRELAPSGYLQLTPTPPQGHAVSVAGNVAGQDFGNVVLESISGQVFADANGNGQLDAGETGLGNWTVYLDTNGNGRLDAGERSQVTPASGNYSFTGLSAGSYAVRIVPQAGYQTTSPAGGFYTVTVQSGTTATGINFGNFQPGSIAGQVFLDTNGDGALDNAETGLSGWTVYVDTNSNGQFDPGEPSQTTDASGNYSFTGLASGTCLLRMLQSPGYQLISPASGSYSIPVQSGTAVTATNFALFQPGSISGQVFADINDNGLLDGGEMGAAGWTVYLDTNGNGQPDPGETSLVTDATGIYSFTGLLAGTYTIRIGQRAGYQTTRPSGGSYSVPVQSGTAVDTKDFGIFRLGSIAGQVFADANGNGQPDTGENGLGGWTVYLDENNNGQLDVGEASQITAGDGGYLFVGLTPATYSVRAMPQAGYQPTEPAGGLYSVTVQWATATTAADFGEQAFSIAPGTPALMSLSDTGISNSDRLTRLNNSSAETALEFAVAQTVPGSTVILYADGQPVGSAVASSATTLITTDGTTLLGDGAHMFIAAQIEAGKVVSIASGSLSITIDATPPATPVAGPSLAPGSDTGVSATDNITTNLTPTFSSDAGPYFRLYRDGVQISGNYEVGATTAGTQPGGTGNFTVTAVDAAGNESGQSPAVAVTFDATPPSATINPPLFNPMLGPASPMLIVFTKPVYGFDLSHLTLSRDGFPISLAGATLDSPDHVHFSLSNLADLTALPGTYVLAAMDTGVTDAAGNPLANSPSQAWTNTLLSGTGGDDQVKIVRDAADATLADVYVNSASASFQVRVGNLPLLQTNLGDGNDTLTVDFSNGDPLPAGGTAFDGGAGDNVLTLISPPGGNALTAEPGRFLFNTTAIDLTGVDSVLPISTDGKDTLTVAAGASLKLAELPYKTLFVSGLTIAGDASLDLGDNSLVLGYGTSSPLATLTQDIVNGRDGLSGAKLIATATTASPSALGLVDNQLLHLSTWAGRQIDDGTHHQIIVKFTYAGDTNLDGQVTQADLYNVFANQGKSGGWLAGDVNLDGDVDPADLQAVLANMGAGTGDAKGSQL